MQPQSKEAASVIDRLAAVTQLQELCSCKRGEKVAYVCVKQSCPNHKKQPLYCILCADDEVPAHDHQSRLISSLNTSLST